MFTPFASSKEKASTFFYKNVWLLSVRMIDSIGTGKDPASAAVKTILIPCKSNLEFLRLLCTWNSTLRKV